MAKSLRTYAFLLESSLDIGEAHAIALAVEFKANLSIIDEKKGRKTAKSLNLNITGFGGILIRAKSKNIIPAIKPYLERAEKETGFFLSQNVKSLLLKIAKEN